LRTFNVMLGGVWNCDYNKWIHSPSYLLSVYVNVGCHIREVSGVDSMKQ